MRSRIAGHSLVMKRFALAGAEPRRRAGSDEHADTALDDDQAFVLESLICLGDRQRIGALFGGKRTDRGKGVAIAISAGKDCIGNHLTKADVNGLFVGAS